MMRCIGRHSAWFVICAIACAADVAQSDVTYAFDTTSVLVAEKIDNFDTYGDDMAGMRVKARFADGFEETATWEVLDESISLGGANGNNWSVMLQGSSGIDRWQLHNGRTSTLMSVVLYGAPGNTAFDIVDDAELTPGSQYGLPFIPTLNEPNIDVLYSQPIALQGSDPLLDIYTTMEVDFSRMNGLATDADLLFYTDTDIYIPAPGTVAGASILAGMLSRRRRRALL